MSFTDKPNITIIDKSKEIQAIKVKYGVNPTCRNKPF